MLPDKRLWNFYGQTEIAPLATVLQPDEQLTKPGSAGRVTLNAETRWSTMTSTTWPLGVLAKSYTALPRS